MRVEPFGSDLPLDGLTVIDFSQFLAGPVAALRLADLGAQVIKVERPFTGDIGRTLSFAGRRADGDTLSFHAMNRNKLGVSADLKDPTDMAFIRRLVEDADVVIQNFRPGVMDRIGLGFEEVRKLNPGIVYASASGYGENGPWRDRPGQDLLAQAVSGLPWLNGSNSDGPVTVGLAIADHLTSCHLAQGITALLVRRFRTGRGGLVETSLMEGMLDLQFELLTARLNDPDVTVRRGSEISAHAFLPAPYGTYRTEDGYVAIAMNPVDRIGELLQSNKLSAYSDPAQWWTHRETIQAVLQEALRQRTTRDVLDLFDAADIWCAPLLTLDELLDHEAFEAIDMVQSVRRPRDRDGERVQTTRSPIRIDGRVLRSEVPAPKIGEHDDLVRGRYAREEGQR